jgi:uncharacterized protein (TIGR02646 family)
MEVYKFNKHELTYIKNFSKLDRSFKKNAWKKFSDDEVKDIHKNIKQHYIKQQKFRCSYCQNEILVTHGLSWDIEHIISRDENPNFTYETLNLCACCKDCNQYKSNKTITYKNHQSRYPKNEKYFKIPHPHLSIYKNHINKKGNIYSPLTQEGAYLILICNLTRFVEMKLLGLDSTASLDNKDLLDSASHSLNRYIDDGKIQDLLILKGSVDALLEKRLA